MDCFDTSRFAIKRDLSDQKVFALTSPFFIFLWMREGTVSRTSFITAWCCRGRPPCRPARSRGFAFASKVSSWPAVVGDGPCAVPCDPDIPNLYEKENHPPGLTE